MYKNHDTHNLHTVSTSAVHPSSESQDVSLPQAIAKDKFTRARSRSLDETSKTADEMDKRAESRVYYEDDAGNIVDAPKSLASERNRDSMQSWSYYVPVASELGFARDTPRSWFWPEEAICDQGHTHVHPCRYDAPILGPISRPTKQTPKVVQIGTNRYVDVYQHSESSSDSSDNSLEAEITEMLRRKFMPVPTAKDTSGADFQASDSDTTMGEVSFYANSWRYEEHPKDVYLSDGTLKTKKHLVPTVRSAATQAKMKKAAAATKRTASLAFQKNQETQSDSDSDSDIKHHNTEQLQKIRAIAAQTQTSNWIRSIDSNGKEEISEVIYTKE